MYNDLMMCRVCKKDGSPETVYQAVRGFGIDRTFQILRCRQCSIVFTYPFLEGDELERYYDNQMVAFNGEGGQVVMEQYLNDKESNWRKMGYLRRLEEIKSLAPPGSSVLDVGCGAGLFLDCLRANGYDVYGIELSQWGARTAVKELGLKVHKTNLPGLVNKSIPKFKVITMFDVLEHSTNPEADLIIARELLVEGGSLVINLPNINSLISRLTGPSWNKLIPPNHTFHFSTKTLKKILEKSGFEIVHMQTNHGDPAEFMGEAGAAAWRLIGKVINPIAKAYDEKDLPYKGEPLTAVVKATQKLFRKAAPAHLVLYPVLSKFEAGEGIHAVAAKK
jgi:2-polyprenyl-3-methyl-5-hydroxy-6-metoxy-1,4-benzoquinol methylase